MMTWFLQTDYHIERGINEDDHHNYGSPYVCLRVLCLIRYESKNVHCYIIRKCFIGKETKTRKG